MRIDLLITELDVGGAEQALTNLAIFLNRNGHDIRLISIGECPPTDRNRLVDRLISEGIRPIFLDGKSLSQSFKLSQQLWKLIKADPPQIALSFLFHANLFAGLMYPSQSVPFITGVRVADRNWKRAIVGRWIYRRAASVVAVSQAVAKHLNQFERCPAEKIAVIGNGLDVDLWQASDLKSQHDTGDLIPNGSYLLYVGRYARQKRIDRIETLLQTYTAEQLPQRIVLIGDGELDNYVTNLVERFPNRIVNLGRRDDIATWMKRADLLLLPSDYEGMPNVVLEAMASGLAVATTKVEGIEELLGENYSTQTALAKDWPALVHKLAGDKATRKEISELNFKRCQKNFSADSKAMQYEALLKQFAR